MRDRRVAAVRGALWQAIAFGAMGLAVFLLLRTTSANLQAKGIASGFGFLDSIARLPVANASLSFESGTDTYGRALLIGLVNTLKVAAVAAVLSTVLGALVGAGRLSRNPMVRAVCAAYVEAMRNVPVLLHIFIWYQVMLALPGLPDGGETTWMILSNRGLYLPALDISSGFPFLQFPSVDGLDVAGGVSVSPEYAALCIGIGTYTASFIAEIVRGAVLALPKGQWEAARAIGLPEGRAFRRIILPQALRVAIPPATSEYLGVLKNSSLAVAIGYQDLVAMGNSILFETGQAIEVVGLVMAFYVVASLAVSALMGMFNRRLALVER